MSKIKKTWETLKKEFLGIDAHGNYVINHHAVALVKFAHFFAEEGLNFSQTDALLSILSQEDIKLREEIVQRLEFFLPELIEEGFFYASPQIEHLDPNEVRSNIFNAYWTIISHANESRNIIPPEIGTKDQLTQLIKQCRPYRLNLRNQDLRACIFNYVELKGADFSFAQLDGASFIHAHLNHCIFYNAELSRANFYEADLSVAFMSFANLQNANLSHAILRGSTLHGANLRNCDLIRADLSNSVSDYCNFQDADLSLAKLDESNVQHSSFQEAKLNQANFHKAKLNYASFRQADLYQANFANSEIEETEWDVHSMKDADFRGTTDEQNLQVYFKNQGAKV